MYCVSAPVCISAGINCVFRFDARNMSHTQKPHTAFTRHLWRTYASYYIVCREKNDDCETDRLPSTSSTVLQIILLHFHGIRQLRPHRIRQLFYANWQQQQQQKMEEENRKSSRHSPRHRSQTQFNRRKYASTPKIETHDDERIEVSKGNSSQVSRTKPFQYYLELGAW